MKKIALYFLMTIPVLLSSVVAVAQNIPEEEGEMITVTAIIPENGPHRSTAIIPFSVEYYVNYSCVCVSFTSNIGNITITLTNLTTDSHYSTVVDSCAGSVLLPVSLGTGFYRIEFNCLDSGNGYVGYFNN